MRTASWRDCTRQSVLGLRVTKDGALVQSVRMSAKSTQKLRGEVADDAKLDRVSLEDVTQESTQVDVPGAMLTFTLSVLRTAELDMRSGATRNAQVRVSVGGLSARDAARTADAYAQSFPDLIREERDNYARRESQWQASGTCAKLTFDPASGALRLREGQDGQVTGTVEANVGGVAAKAKWTVTTQANAAFTPQAAEAPVLPFRYTVTRTGPDVRVSASFKATSTAGVAEGTWSQPTEADVFYAVDAVTDVASHSGSVSGDALPCRLERPGERVGERGAAALRSHLWAFCARWGLCWVHQLGDPAAHDHARRLDRGVRHLRHQRASACLHGLDQAVLACLDLRRCRDRAGGRHGEGHMESARDPHR